MLLQWIQPFLLQFHNKIILTLILHRGRSVGLLVSHLSVLHPLHLWLLSLPVPVRHPLQLRLTCQPVLQGNIQWCVVDITEFSIDEITINEIEPENRASKKYSSAKSGAYSASSYAPQSSLYPSLSLNSERKHPTLDFQPTNLSTPSTTLTNINNSNSNSQNSSGITPQSIKLIFKRHRGRLIVFWRNLSVEGIWRKSPRRRHSEVKAQLFHPPRWLSRINNTKGSY